MNRHSGIFSKCTLCGRPLARGAPVASPGVHARCAMSALLEVAATAPIAADRAAASERLASAADTVVFVDCARGTWRSGRDLVAALDPTALVAGG